MSKSKKKLQDKLYGLVFRQMGGAVNGTELTCSGRAGVVYLETNRGRKVLARSEVTGNPIVVGCEHEAVDLIVSYMETLFVAFNDGDIGVDSIPSLSDFSYRHTESATNEPEMDLSDAAAVIANIKKRVV